MQEEIEIAAEDVKTFKRNGFRVRKEVRYLATYSGKKPFVRTKHNKVAGANTLIGVTSGHHKFHKRDSNEAKVFVACADFIKQNRVNGLAKRIDLMHHARQATGLTDAQVSNALSRLYHYIGYLYIEG